MVNMKVCNYCPNRRFSNRSNLNRHIRSKHSIELKKTPTKSPIETCSFKCLEGCNVLLENISELRSHLQSVHNIDPEEDEYIFDDIGEFNEWLNELEDTFGYKYVKKSQNSKSKYQPTNFNCHQSEILREINDPTELNDQGTMKMRVGCTSQIRLTQEQGKCLVTYFKAHYGHSIEPEHLTIPNDVRIKVVSQPASEEPIKRLIIKESGGSKRNILLKKRDRNNIKKSQVYTKTKIQDDLIKDDRDSDSENDCTIKTKKQKLLPNTLFNSPDDSHGRIAKSKELIQNIQIEISRLNEQIETEKNIKVLSHVLETLTTENKIIAALKQGNKFKLM